MPTHTARITDRSARELPPPAAGYVIHWCPKTPGFGVRVTAAGARAWITERRVDGKSVRRTLGTAPGSTTLKHTFGDLNAEKGVRVGASGVISADAARAVQLDVSSALQQGKDPLAVVREKRKAEKIEAITLNAAVRAYVKHKRRTKDGLALKARTQADYVAMVEPPGATAAGRATMAGELHGLAGKPLHRITADDIRKLHASLEQRGERRQAYAMQVLRAVLRHEGVTIEGDPLSPATAGAKRVRLAVSKGNPTPIPPERLGAWWRAAGDLGTVGADQLRFQLLTGCRPGEVAAISVADFDAKGERVILHDTKNRADHTLVLSKQAAAIAFWHAQGKKPKDRLFGVADAGKSLEAINAAADVQGITAHKLRHTFASIAAEIVPAFTLRRLLNHTGGGDTAAVHYVHVSEAQLRAGWQAVADFIDGAK